MLGEYFGYPECCIKSFYDTPFEEYELRTQCSEGTGFIPCAACARKIAEGEIELADLIQNRICPTPFPENDVDQTKSWMEQQKNNGL